MLTRPTCPAMRARGPTMGGAVEDGAPAPPSASPELAADEPRFHSRTAPSAEPDTRSIWKNVVKGENGGGSFVIHAFE